MKRFCYKAKQRGAALIEAAMTIGIFLLFFFMAAEIAYVGYIKSVFYAAAQSSARQLSMGNVTESGARTAALSYLDDFNINTSKFPSLSVDADSNPATGFSTVTVSADYNEVSFLTGTIYEHGGELEASVAMKNEPDDD